MFHISFHGGGKKLNNEGLLYNNDRSTNNSIYLFILFSRIYHIIFRKDENIISYPEIRASIFETLSRWRRFTCPTTSCLVSLTSTRKVTKKKRNRERERERGRTGREGREVKCLRATNWNPSPPASLPPSPFSILHEPLEPRKKKKKRIKSYTDRAVKVLHRRSFSITTSIPPPSFLSLPFSFSFSFRRLHLTSLPSPPPSPHVRVDEIFQQVVVKKVPRESKKERRKRKREARATYRFLVFAKNRCLRFRLKNVARNSAWWRVPRWKCQKNGESKQHYRPIQFNRLSRPSYPYRTFPAVSIGAGVWFVVRVRITYRANRLSSRQNLLLFSQAADRSNIYHPSGESGNFLPLKQICGQRCWTKRCI